MPARIDRRGAAILGGIKASASLVHGNQLGNECGAIKRREISAVEVFRYLAQTPLGRIVRDDFGPQIQTFHLRGGVAMPARYQLVGRLARQATDFDRGPLPLGLHDAGQCLSPNRVDRPQPVAGVDLFGAQQDDLADNIGFGALALRGHVYLPPSRVGLSAKGSTAGKGDTWMTTDWPL